MTAPLPYLWEPQPGPQRALLYLPDEIEEVFYGGARGGGKTDGSLGDWLAHEAQFGAGARGLFVRRISKDLDDVLLRAHMLYPQVGATWNGTTRSWTFPSGAVLRLRHLKDTLAAGHYQGHAYCVEVGTPILTASGQSVAIESIRVGDLVQTLEGPKRVLGTTAPYKATCVEATSYLNGSEIGRQVHPETHSILSTVGWLDYASCRAGDQTGCRGFARVLRGAARPELWIDRAVLHAPSLRSAGVDLAAGRVRGHSREWSAWYVHPYTGEVRPCREETVLGAVRLRPCGSRWVADLTVEDANHYIAADTALISQNTRIYFEEAGQWPTPDAYLMMRGALRPPSGSRTPCRMISTGNPGGAGHAWLKGRFIDPAPRGYLPLKDPVSGHSYVFIPAKLEDNQKLMQADPGYDKRLRVVGNRELVRAWRDGAWDLVIGSYFADVWAPEKQRLPNNLIIPDSWTWRRSFDWGSAKPSSLGIWAVSSGEPIREGHFTNRIFPRGSMVRVGEWYTAEVDHLQHVVPNKGLRLDNTVLGQGIAKLSLHFRPQGGWDGCVADGEIFKEDGGESIFSQMQRGARIEGHSLSMYPADKRRIAGWQRVYGMLAESTKQIPEGPGMWYLDRCLQFVRTMPLLQMDVRNPEDVDTDGEDHTGDESRYAAMSVMGGLTVISR